MSLEEYSLLCEDFPHIGILAKNYRASRGKGDIAAAMPPGHSYAVGSLTKAERKPMLPLEFERALLPENEQAPLAELL